LLSKPTASPIRTKWLGWFIILLGVYATASSGTGYGIVAIAGGVLIVIPIASSTRTRLFGWAAIIGGILATALRGSLIGLVATVCGALILVLRRVRNRDADAGDDDAPTGTPN
jgi:hypothetical protein